MIKCIIRYIEIPKYGLDLIFTVVLFDTSKHPHTFLFIQGINIPTRKTPAMGPAIALENVPII